jgi:hypothetical protein
MKEKYLVPDAEVININSTDIITDSGCPVEGEEDPL